MGGGQSSGNSMLYCGRGSNTYLSYAPYRLYKEQGAKLDALAARGNKEIREKLAEFLVEGEHWKSICQDRNFKSSLEIKLAYG
jgi:hypothetical protein